MIRFEKVSFEQFEKDCQNIFGAWYSTDELRALYDEIKLPQRATSGSAGYDFYFPFDELYLHTFSDVVVPTGIRCVMDKNVVLQIYPRSGMGFKYGVELKNTVGIIDSDYINSDNEGHIMVKLVNKDISGDNSITSFAFAINSTDPRESLRHRSNEMADKLTEIDYVELEQGKAFCQGLFVNYLTTDDDNADKNRNGGFGSTDTL